MELHYVIRKEEQKDYAAIFKLIKEAFATMKYSSGDEQFLVERLRKSEAYIPELSLVAESNDGRILGHILLSKVHIKNQTQCHETLSLAPVSVLLQYHKNGIGSALIKEAHIVAGELGHSSVVLVGHADYYPKFGYRPSIEFGIEFPFKSAVENCMVCELVSGSLDGVNGKVVYPKEFFE